MHPAIARLDHLLAAQRPTLHATLSPPASPADLDAVETRFGLTLPPLLRQLLSWRNGQNPEYEECLVEYWALMSTTMISGALGDMLWLVENDDFGNLWGPDWVPFLENVYGDFVCIDLRGGFGGVPGQIVEFKHEDDHRHITYPSLDAWLETVVSALESGILVFEPSQVPSWDPADFAVYEDFIAERNPGYPTSHYVW